MTSWRSFTYKALGVSNDLNAVRRGRVGARVARRAVGRPIGLAFWRWFK